MLPDVNGHSQCWSRHRQRTRESDFRIRLKTWAYRVAVNYILDVKKSSVERMHLSFERFAEDLADGLSAEGPTDAERSLLVEEVKIGCTLGMLQCLDRPHRLAYVLGEILDLPGPDVADALEMRPTPFASVFSTRARRSFRSRRPTVGWCQIRPPAPAIVVCRLRCALEELDLARSTSRRPLRLFRRHVQWFGRSTKPDGHSTSTERTVLVTPRSTSRVVWPEP